VEPECLEVTNEGYESSDAWVASFVKANNILFEYISKDVFSTIDASGSVLQIWTSICDIHEGSSDVNEEKYYVIKCKYDNLSMLPNEDANKVYFCLHVHIEQINTLKIKTFNSIVTMLFQQELTKLKIDQVIGKINAHENYNLDKILSLNLPRTWLFKLMKMSTRRKRLWLRR
jgi:hypothetical protein